MSARVRSTLLFVLLVSAAWVGGCEALRTPPQQAKRGAFYTTAYLTKEQALQTVFPDARKVLRDDVVLTREERQAAETLLGQRIRRPVFRVYLGTDESGEFDGFAVIHEEIGKFKPITFIVSAEPNREVRRVAVMVYREARGNEVATRRFLVQYPGKSVEAPFSINRDIINITGATMSVNSMNLGVKKILSVLEIVYGRQPERLEAVLRGGATELELGPQVAPSHRSAARDDSVVDVSERCRSDAIVRVREARLVMGSWCEIEAWGNDRVQLQRACRRAFLEVERVDRALSDYRPESELSIVSQRAAFAPVTISDLTADFLGRAQLLAERTDGAFDLTIGPLVDAWGFRGRRGATPDRDTLLNLRPLVDYRNVRLLRTDGLATRVSLSVEGMRLDPGGLGKGFAVDRAVSVLQRSGVSSALMNFSGNLYALGTPPGQRGWTVGVRDPANPDALVGHLLLKDEAVASSGGYEKFREVNGKKLSHILSPRTLFPVADVVGSSVLAPTATLADGWSTVTAVRGEAGILSMREEEGIEGMVVLRDAHGVTRRVESAGWRSVRSSRQNPARVISAEGGQRVSYLSERGNS